MKTIITLLLDRSGSMYGKEADVVGGVNQFIADQQKLPQEDTITMSRFDTDGVETFRARTKVADAKPIDANDFVPRGGTPLLDAVGRTIAQMEEDWKAEKPDRAILVIFTDGEENQSREFTKAKIQELIKARQDSGLWAFIYLGTHADAFHEAGHMGIYAVNTARTSNTGLGTRTAYAAGSASVMSMKVSGQMMADNLGDLDENQPGTTPAPTVTVKATTWTPPAPTGPWTPPA